MRPFALAILALLAAPAVGLGQGCVTSEAEAARYFDQPEKQLVVAAARIRAEIYWDEVVRAARRHGVPESIFFGAAVVESAFYPYAVSPTGAEGLWQFKPATGEDYGLRSRADRFDVTRSADAAARYLADLYRRFGSWDLALAAYNRGPTRLAEVIREVGSRDWTTVQRHVRSETCSYVAKIRYLANTLYPAFLEGAPPPVPLTVVRAESGATWYGLARRYGVTQNELRALNNGLLLADAPIVVPAGVPVAEPLPRE